MEEGEVTLLLGKVLFKNTFLKLYFTTHQPELTEEVAGRLYLPALTLPQALLRVNCIVLFMNAGHSEG